jgi:hypothetical protein
MGEVAARLGKPFKPWQQHLADVAGEIDLDTGLPAYSEVVLIGPRQIGKSELIVSALTHRCLGFEHAGAQRVLYTAQASDMARMRWRDEHLERLLRAPRIRKQMADPADMYGGARLRQNQETIFWANGSMWSPGSTTGKTSGTGATLDMGVIDEAWSRPDNRTELGMLPTMDTRPWSQLWVLSMIPGLSRAAPGTWPYLAHKREIGRARVEAGMRSGIAFFDFAAAEGMDPSDPATWWSAHPGLGQVTTEAKIRDRFENMDLVDFCAEYLGWAPLASAPRWTLVGQETWGRLRDPDSHIEGRPGLALEVDEDRGSAVIGVAGRRGDGHWHGAVAEPGYEIAAGVAGLGWVLRRTVDLYRELKACTVVIDPARPASSFIVPLRNAGVDVTTPNQREVAGACGRFFDATGEEQRDDDDGVRIFHLGQPDLDRSLAGARKLDVGQGAFVFVKKGSAAAIKHLYAVVLAMHGVDVKGGVSVPDPEIFFGGDDDSDFFDRD